MTSFQQIYKHFENTIEQYYFPVFDDITNQYLSCVVFSPLNTNLRQVSKYLEDSDWFEKELHELFNKIKPFNPKNPTTQITFFEDGLERYDLFREKIFLVIKASSVLNSPIEHNQTAGNLETAIGNLTKQMQKIIASKQFLQPITRFLSSPNHETIGSLAYGTKEVFLNDGKKYKISYEGSGWIHEKMRRNSTLKFLGYVQMKQMQQYLHQCDYMTGIVHSDNIASFKSIAYSGTVPWKDLHFCEVSFFVHGNGLEILFPNAEFKEHKQVKQFFKFQQLMFTAYENGNLLTNDLATLFFNKKFVGCFTNKAQTFGVIIFKASTSFSKTVDSEEECKEVFVVNNIFYTKPFTKEEKIIEFESLMKSILHNIFEMERCQKILLVVTTNEASPIYSHLLKNVSRLEMTDPSYRLSQSKFIKVVTRLGTSPNPQQLPITLSDKLFNDFREISQAPMSKVISNSSKL